MVGQGPTRRSTTLRSSSSAMRKTGETPMRRELRATRSPSQLLVRNGPLKQMAKRATPPAANHPLPRRPGQRPLGLQRQSRGLLPQSLPHPHLTGAPPGTGAPLGTTQIAGALPASPQHPKMRMRLGGSGESSLHLKSPWLWSEPGDGERRRNGACRRNAGQPVPRNSSDSMRSLGHLTSGSNRNLLYHLLPLLPPLHHLRPPKNSPHLQLLHRHQSRHLKKNQKSRHRPLLPSPPPLQVWLQLPPW